MIIIKLIFFVSLFMVLYVYLVYPTLVFILGKIINRKVEKGFYEPFVTILMPAYNEEACIENTLLNKLELDYPKEKLEIIVISDGSNDRTDEIVKGYKGQGIVLIRQEPRAGKTSALNMAVLKAKGSVLAFSDANSIWAKDALIKLVQNFNDQGVGYVTGKMIYTNPDGSTTGDGCSTYMKYENYLRCFETKAGSIVGVDGGIDAVRKELYQPMNPDQLPDFILPLQIVEQGFRVVYEPEAILKEAALKTSEEEYQMRVRVSLRALWAFWDMRHLLTFTGSKLFAWQIWSHKLLRYMCFIFLIGVYLTNLPLWDQGRYYQFFFIIQNMAYLTAAVSLVFNKKIYSSRLLGLLNYFVLLNLASAHAFVRFFLRQRQVVWIPRKG